MTKQEVERMARVSTTLATYQQMVQGKGLHHYDEELPVEKIKGRGKILHS